MLCFQVAFIASIAQRPCETMATSVLYKRISGSLILLGLRAVDKWWNMAAAVSTDHSSDLSANNNDTQWRQIGDYYELRKRKCQRIHSKRGKRYDLGLFYREGKFYALTAWCSHMGGPLYNGDIEDYKGKAHVMCPWHGYMFDLETGQNEIGFGQDVHPVKVEHGRLYIQYETELSLYPFL